MSRVITAHEATVKTAAVEVKTLTISGKQVTLAVFRQLPNERLLDAETADLRGVPWGKVNYFWGNCKADHLHVVWQEGQELRRSCVYPSYEWEEGWRMPTERVEVQLEVWLALSALRGAHTFEVREYNQHRRAAAERSPVGVVDLTSSNKARCWIARRWFECAISDSVRGMILRPQYEYYRDQVVEEIRQMGLSEEVTPHAFWHQGSNIYCGGESIVALLLLAGQFGQKWSDRYEALSSLDQLFIAV